MARDRNNEPVAAPEIPAATVPNQYIVLVSFADPDDKAAPSGSNVYWAGKNLYPRVGYTPTEERIAYLQSGKTSFKKPVIASTVVK